MTTSLHGPLAVKMEVNAVTKIAGRRAGIGPTNYINDTDLERVKVMMECCCCM
jgi:hypothetical protein